MEFNRRDENVSVVSNLERILPDVHRTATAPSPATLVGHSPMAFHSLGTSLEKVATPGPGMEEGGTFDGFTDRPVSEERPNSSILPAHFAPSAKLEDTMPDQIPSISFIVLDAAICLFGDAQ